VLFLQRLWESLSQVFPEAAHQQVDKDTGLVAHMERWDNTLRQWLARYTRKTLAFFRSDFTMRW
jgi:insertion element IS1 protein InsB